MLVQLPGSRYLAWIGGPDTGEAGDLETVAMQVADAVVRYNAPPCENGKMVMVVLTENDVPMAVCLGDMGKIKTEGDFVYIILTNGERFKLTVEPGLVSDQTIEELLRSLTPENGQMVLAQTVSGQVVEVGRWELPPLPVEPPGEDTTNYALEALRYNLGYRDGMIPSTAEVERYSLPG